MWHKRIYHLNADKFGDVSGDWPMYKAMIGQWWDMEIVFEPLRINEAEPWCLEINDSFLGWFKSPESAMEMAARFLAERQGEIGAFLETAMESSIS